MDMDREGNGEEIISYRYTAQAQFSAHIITKSNTPVSLDYRPR
jgi:hypothetical protein